ncbi:MAG: sodium:proton antiporter NhaD [Bacteroidales bacterium]
MITIMIIVFLLGYTAIALEQQIKINKSAIALIMGMTLWVMYVLDGTHIVPFMDPQTFSDYIKLNPDLAAKTLATQYNSFITNFQIVEYIGNTAEIIFFLIAAMTIVELIDSHGGFTVITQYITAKRKKSLLWIIGFFTFFLSAILDNMTTAIVMIMLIRKLITDKEERWLFTGLIIIAANAGGAWSPVGDIATILLWVHGNVTTVNLVKFVFLPSVISLIVPLILISFRLRGETESSQLPGNNYLVSDGNTGTAIIKSNYSVSILVIGLIGILFVPLFKALTNLPPAIGILLSLGMIWLYTEILNKRSTEKECDKIRVSSIIHNIDTSTILYLLGILMAVGALEVSGILAMVSGFLNTHIGNPLNIDMFIGLISSIIDNSSLVAGTIGMYPIQDSAHIHAAFLADAPFWHFLSYCAGTGGSIMIIGSAAGVVSMGLEKITFMWYLKNITLYALFGYLAGAGVFLLLEHLY